MREEAALTEPFSGPWGAETWGASPSQIDKGWSSLSSGVVGEGRTCWEAETHGVRMFSPAWPRSTWRIYLICSVYYLDLSWWSIWDKWCYAKIAGFLAMIISSDAWVPQLPCRRVQTAASTSREIWIVGNRFCGLSLHHQAIWHTNTFVTDYYCIWLRQ